MDPISPIGPISLISPIGSIKQNHDWAIRPAVVCAFQSFFVGSMILRWSLGGELEVLPTILLMQ